MLNRLVTTLCMLTMYLGGCATSYVPPKDGPTATLIVHGIVTPTGSTGANSNTLNGQTSLFLINDPVTCKSLTLLAGGLKPRPGKSLLISANSSKSILISANKPTFLKLQYVQLTPMFFCNYSIQFTPENGAMYSLSLDEISLQKGVCKPIFDTHWFYGKSSTDNQFQPACVKKLSLEQVQQYIQDNIPIYKAVDLKMDHMRSNPPDNNMAILWKNLDAQDKTLSGKTWLASSAILKDNKNLVDISSWLKWKIISQNAEARYSYAYSSNLSHIRDKDGGYEFEAAVYFFLSRLSLAIDGARCVDKTSPDIIGKEYEMSMRPINEMIIQSKKDWQAGAMLQAVSIELMRGERPPIGYLCMRGARAGFRAFALGREITLENMSPSDAKNHLGVSGTIDTSGVEPEFIPENEWRLKRKNILDDYVKTAFEML